MLIAAVIASSSSSSLSLGGTGLFHCPKCHVEPIVCSTSYRLSLKQSSGLQGIAVDSGLSFRTENSLFGTTQLRWIPLGHDIYISRISVAADFPDAVPDSTSYATHNGYHPLEELRDNRHVRDKNPTSAEIARTAVEANNRALLIFPGFVHREPHEHISWADYEYVIDDFGDIYFEIYDGQNILQDREASNPVTALIGMDISYYESRKMDLLEDSMFEIDPGDDVSVDDEYFEVTDPDLTDIQIDWGMPENSTWIHPIHFAKCLAKVEGQRCNNAEYCLSSGIFGGTALTVVDVEHDILMDYPSNGVSICGLLRPTYTDEEYYLRRLFNGEYSDGSELDCKDEEVMNCNSGNNGTYLRSTIYRLEITRIELFTVYGVQSVVRAQDFQYAEPDVLVHSNTAILERFGEQGTSFSLALKALCKKKGLHIERANLIGVDSLGMDVRVSSGTEVQTHRFSFKARVASECAADKQIQQLLFPRSRRKKRTLDRPTRDVDAFS